MSTLQSNMTVSPAIPAQILKRKDVEEMLNAFGATTSFETNNLKRIEGGDGFSEDAVDLVDDASSPFYKVSDFGTFLQELLKLLDETKYPKLVMQEQSFDETTFWSDATIVTRNEVYYCDLQKVLDSFIDAISLTEAENTSNAVSNHIHVFAPSFLTLFNAKDMVQVACKLSKSSSKHIVADLLKEKLYSAGLKPEINPKSLTVFTKI